MTRPSAPVASMFGYLLCGTLAQASDFYVYHTRLDYVIPVGKEQLERDGLGDPLLKIGTAAEDFGGPFSGQIDDVVIYKRALTAREVAALASGGSVSEDVAARYRFDNSPNDSTNGRHAVLKGGAGFLANARQGSHCLQLDGQEQWVSSPLKLASDEDFSWAAWVRTTDDGTVIAYCSEKGQWHPGGRCLFVEGGVIKFDVGWVGVLDTGARVGDGKWHHVALSACPVKDEISIYVDGKLEGSKGGWGLGRDEDHRGITGKYADIVVSLGRESRLVFGRLSGYCPYWETAHGKWFVDEIVKRDKDAMCRYCYARVVKNTPNEILVHWRYMPDLDNAGFDGVVHEYFRVTPDGKAERTVRRATNKADVWKIATQTLRLEPGGIREVTSAPLRLRRAVYTEVTRSPVKSAVVGSPVMWFRFDEGFNPNKDTAKESIRGTECLISGHKSLWKAGVSGTALAFDGYYCKVTLPASKTPTINRALTVDAWLALGAYPWNRAPVVHHSAGSGESGYYLGVDPYGYPIFSVSGKSVKAAKRLDLYRWSHMAGTFGEGKMAIYVDGRKVGSRSASGGISPPDTDLLVGLNNEEERPTDPVRGPDNNLPVVFGLEGLIDELKVYDRALSPAEIADSFREARPGPEITNNPDLQRRILPGEVAGEPARGFGAYYTKLRYHDLWDNIWRTSDWPDLVVRFDQLPTGVVYWRGTNYGPGWVTENNRWMSDQSCETGGPHGCAEHMADKQLRHGHLRLIENTDARVVVHWRYPSIDVGYKFPGPRQWADEYHTIYPDGTAVRKVHFHGGNPGWQDVQFLSQPGTTCLENVDLQALTLANLSGEVRKLRWSGSNGVPRNTLPDACIEIVNFKSKYRVFVIFQEGTYINPWGHREQSRHTDDPFAGPWNHWPVSQIPSDGRFAVADDRLTHAALAAADNVVDHGNMAIYGFTKQPISTLVPLARYWNNPPEIGDVDGCRAEGFDKAQRAYVLTASGPTLSFRVHASEDSPLVDPCFVIKEFGGSQTKARLTINGFVRPEGKDFRQGIVRDTDGAPVLVIWIKHQATASTSFRIDKCSEHAASLDQELSSAATCNRLFHLQPAAPANRSEHQGGPPLSAVLAG